MLEPMPGTSTLTGRASWKALQAHHDKVKGLHLRTLFADDATRGERLTAEAAGLQLEKEPTLGHDSSTNRLVRRYRARRGAGR